MGGARLGLRRRRRRPRRPRAARGAARGARGRPAGRRPHRDGQGQGLRARPRTAGWRAWRSGTPPSRSRSPTAPPVRARRRPPAPPSPPPQYTKVFGEAMVEEVRRDRRVVGITAAMNSGTGLNMLQKAEPEHYFDVGIAEQQAVLFAAGLALEGAKPVCAIYSTFLQRAYDQIVHDVCLQKLDVVFAHGPRGPRRRRRPDAPRRLRHRLPAPLPNIVLMAPRDEAMLERMLRTALAHDDGPVALRYPRGEARRRAAAGPEGVTPIEIGTRRGPARGRAASRSWATAPGSRKALEAADLLAERGLRRHGRRRALRQAARRRSCSRSSPPSTSCSSRSRRASSRAASARRCGRR